MRVCAFVCAVAVVSALLDWTTCDNGALSLALPAAVLNERGWNLSDEWQLSAALARMGRAGCSCVMCRHIHWMRGWLITRARIPPTIVSDS